jgi:excisionase family DNA binding protein
MKSENTAVVLTLAERLASDGALTIGETASWSGLGRGTVYEEIRDGRLRIAKVGRRTIVRAADARAWLASIPSVASTGGSKTQS